MNLSLPFALTIDTENDFDQFTRVCELIFDSGHQSMPSVAQSRACVSSLTMDR